MSLSPSILSRYQIRGEIGDIDDDVASILSDIPDEIRKYFPKSVKLALRRPSRLLLVVYVQTQQDVLSALASMEAFDNWWIERSLQVKQIIVVNTEYV